MIAFHFLDEVRTNWIDDVNRLIEVLTGRRGEITREHFLAVIRKSRWLAAMEDEEKIVGMATLVSVHIPTGLVGRIEDVARLPSEEYKGLGRELMKRLIDEARRMGMKYLMLTSRPERVRANALYPKLGFVLHETNTYRLVF